MSDTPIRIFAPLSERFPQPTDRDILLSAVETTVGAIPSVGDMVRWVASNFMGPSFQKRREEWWTELASGLESVEARLEDLFADEAFITAAIQATEIALKTHKHEKRILLRNALVNIAAGRSPNDDLQHIYIRAIDDFTPSHVVVLDLLWRGAQRWAEAHMGNPSMYQSFELVVSRLEPEYANENALLQFIINDLKARDFANIPNPDANFPGQYMTNKGIAFLQFVLLPADVHAGTPFSHTARAQRRNSLDPNADDVSRSKQQS